MRYRRSQAPGATYFFTVVTYDRRSILCEPNHVALLRSVFRAVMQQHPFQIDAFVLLPDHLHCIWTLPDNDANFSLRWRLVKSYFARGCQVDRGLGVSSSRQRKQERSVWQRRFWEHQVQNSRDFAAHVDYIHYNPVKHGYVRESRLWAYSSFSRYVEAGQYAADWGVTDSVEFPPTIGHE